jgi:hypothetical protein
MKKISFLLFLFLLSQCDDNKKNVIIADTPKKMKNITAKKAKQTYIEYDKIKHLTYDKLMDSLSKENKELPYSQETFILGEDNGLISEFRVELLAFYPIEKIKNKNILIKEVTWETSPTHNLTIWYEKKNKEWYPIHYIIWNKELEH